MSNDLSAIDIFEDDGTGYTVAGHILSELRAHAAGLESRELGPLIGDDLPGQRVGCWLRQMRGRGEVVKTPVYGYAENSRFRWRAAGRDPAGTTDA